MSPNEYDLEPVFYCKDCMDLCIKTIDGIDYCVKCGSTSIGEAENIFVWKKLRLAKFEKKLK